jgi:hypothetical protein
MIDGGCEVGAPRLLSVPPVQQTCSEVILMKISRNWSAELDRVAEFKMSQRRIRMRHADLPSLPYWRSILASFLLVLAVIFFFEMLADPRSGELRSPGVVTPVLFLFVVADAGLFYAEFRLRKRRPPATVQTQRKWPGNLC